MARVEEIMTRKVVTLSPEEPVFEAARILRENRISGVPVVEGGQVVGVLSEADIMELLESHELKINTILPSPLDVLELPVRMKIGLKEAAERINRAASARVKDIMSSPPHTISPGADMGEAAALMSKKKVNRLPVVDDDGKLVGIVTRGDVIASF
ncbi:MAG: CBS domain-containing protein [Euryarchaeota archaeon]|nr:CBS domain-containing protein [Euryarchaeota archaeon]